jgi:UDP-2,3-diacylglucosamine pyrophosphatase LpxH
VEQYRTVFISDLHLGTKGCNVAKLSAFLDQISCEKLYLVGDIIDFWSMSRKTYFPRSHRAVIQKFLDMAAKGTRVIYVPGNHDENLRMFCPFNVGAVQIIHEDIHTTLTGERLLVTHGDAFDQVLFKARWLAKFGDLTYQWTMQLSFFIQWWLKLFGAKPWSFSKWAKGAVKQAVSFICHFERVVSENVAARGLDGVVCGHIHHAEIKEINGIIYHNCGDFVESCTALVEDLTGELRIIEA